MHSNVFATNLKSGKDAWVFFRNRINGTCFHVKCHLSLWASGLVRICAPIKETETNVTVSYPLCTNFSVNENRLYIVVLYMYVYGLRDALLYSKENALL